MQEFSVRIVLSELTIVADSAERAEEIAIDILDSDARTRLSLTGCALKPARWRSRDRRRKKKQKFERRLQREDCADLPYVRRARLDPRG